MMSGREGRPQRRKMWSELRGKVLLDYQVMLVMVAIIGEGGGPSSVIYLSSLSD